MKRTILFTLLLAMALCASLSAQMTAPLAITTTTLPNAIVGVHYHSTLAGEGGVPPYTWSLQGCAHPAPCSATNTPIGEVTPLPGGTITGAIPLVVGISPFMITLQDSSTPPARVSAPFVITINAAGSRPTPPVLSVGE